MGHMPGSSAVAVVRWLPRVGGGCLVWGEDASPLGRFSHRAAASCGEQLEGGEPPPRPTRRCSRRRCASSEIGAILTAGNSPRAFPIYEGGAAKRQTLDGGPSYTDQMNHQSILVIIPSD